MIKTLLLVITFINLSLTAHAADKLLPFQTDYCTGYTEGTLSDPTAWKDCCLTHDLFFWAGGTIENRDQADHELLTCVEETGHPYQAHLIYLAVRAGSRSPIKIKGKQWNNGWSGREDALPLTPIEIDQIENEISKPDYNYISPQVKDHFLRELRLR
jgi:hypothetical protein